MPYVQIAPPSGPLNVFYSISTPLDHGADAIIPGLPTILFLHPVYMPQQIFESQFADHDLRKCNLIAYDMRSHGETEGVIGDAKYLPVEDAYYFMEAVGLPPCHLFALSIGCCVALELASRYPDRILSMTLCSPLSPVESEEVASGRLEVHEEWTNGTLLPGSVIEQMAIRAETVVAIELALEMDAIVGVKQLAFNNDMDELTSAITESAIAQAQNHWLGTPQKSQEAYRSVIQWPLERKALADKELAKIKAPTNLEAQLKAAGVRVKLYMAPGPHYGCVAGARAINPVALNLVLSCHKSGILSDIEVKAQTTGQMLKTPFQERLKKFDYLSFDPHEIQFFESPDGLDTEQRTIPA